MDALEAQGVMVKESRCDLLGNAEVGLVYRADTLKLQSAVIAASAPEYRHAPIIYPVALVIHGKHPEDAKQFSSYL